MGQGRDEEREGGGWVRVAVEEEALDGAGEEPGGVEEGDGERGRGRRRRRGHAGFLQDAQLRHGFDASLAGSIEGSEM